jgi:predicted component of type VI protein secretion system
MVIVMGVEGNGELVPSGGGETIPLMRTPMLLGRRESCDICLPFPAVSGRHCELNFKNGFWLVRDLNSTNGLKVNGDKVQPGGKKALFPGDIITIAKRQYTIQYVLADRMSRLEEMMLEEEEENIMGVPLLVKAGLEQMDRWQNPRNSPGWDEDDNEKDD